jgi:uncharacterized protein (TIGR02246 family)
MIARATALALITILCTPMLAQTIPPQTQTKAEEDVRALERQWLDAYEKHDSQAMTKIVADDFIITFPNGTMQSKPQLMQMIASPNPTSPKMHFYTEDVKSRAYGDTVILMGRVVTEYEREGKKVKEQSRYTDTYVKRNGRWQVVASHLSSVEEPGKQ